MRYEPSIHFADIDVGLEQAISELRAVCRHLPHGRGRAVLVVELLDRQTVEWNIDRDLLTQGDYDRLMRRAKEGK